MEKVIFRENYNEYTKETDYLAIFPQVEASLGRVFTCYIEYIQGTPYYYHDEIDYNYMLQQRIIHKKDSRIPKLLRDIERIENDHFVVAEKIMR